MSIKMVNIIQINYLWLIKTAISTYNSEFNKVLHNTAKVCVKLDDIYMKMKYLNKENPTVNIINYTGCGEIINQIMEDS